MADTAFTARDWPAWPSYGLVDDLLPVLRRWATTDDAAVLATLVHISGSSPRPLGSEMAISASGEAAGYVSGGCVEGAVAAQAASVLANGTPKMLDYGAGSPVLDVQLTCGGRIGIFVRRIADLAAWVAEHDAARRARRDLFVDIDLDSGDSVLHREPQRGPPAPGFRQHYLPPSRLMLVGGDPVTLAIGELATLLGIEVGLLRPYGPSAPPPGIAPCHYDTRALAGALPDLPLDAWTAVYSLTHDMADDQAVISHALRSPAFRVGVLGSRRKADQRFAELRKAGFEEADLARLNLPAGIAIGATGPREIALSILADITAHRPRPVPRA
ncbi:XdhC family protein [Salinisphaera sp.]|uniref:XdhC family protein n=1 Tax=Salinisphaera sp. TaxID=1914330 RepID=UPI002D76BFDC|nr:XdhC family protein [Salinisphaera sp.]HET7315530.1 XdhC family protein [Salinisphaera sp.]